MTIVLDRVRLPDGGACWPWPLAQNGRGYGYVKFQGRMHGAHRVAWIEANGPIPTGLNVLHHCDNPICCNPAHLFLGTQFQNVDDMVAKKRHSSGTRHWNVKLSEEEVILIRTNPERLSQASLARRYGISPQHVSHVVLRKKWKDIA